MHFYPFIRRAKTSATERVSYKQSRRFLCLLKQIDPRQPAASYSLQSYRYSLPVVAPEGGSRGAMPPPFYSISVDVILYEVSMVTAAVYLRVY